MLSSESVSGVSDDDVLLRCAVFLIFLFAACTIFATKRDDPSLCESRLKAAEENCSFTSKSRAFMTFNLTFDFGDVFQ